VPLTVVFASLVAGFAVRRALQPVEAITDLAGTIGAAETGGRVPVPGTGDEIEHLAVTVNAMLDRLAANRQAQRQFTSDAAHELRTPLMALRGEIDLAARAPDAYDAAFLDRARVLTDRLSARVDDLVLLSTLDEAPPLAQIAVDLAEVAEDEAVMVRAEIVVGSGPTVVTGDRDLLARAVRNLLSNARRQAAERVVITVAREDEAVLVTVDDDGPGVSADAADAIFRRFSRLDPARRSDAGGAGLGLAIVDAVVRAHRGTAAVSSGPLGGARFTLRVPAVAAGQRVPRPEGVKDP
jgi:signal transduction histidine kinase